MERDSKDGKEGPAATGKAEDKGTPPLLRGIANPAVAAKVNVGVSCEDW